jgi:hypothetical protein
MSKIFRSSKVNEIQLNDTTNNYNIILKAPILPSNVVFTLPNNDGTPSQILSTDGNGVLSWTPSGLGNNVNLINITTDSIILNNSGTTTTFIRQLGGTNHTLIWPNAQGTLGSILTNNGNGTMSWSTNINVPNITTSTIILNNSGTSTTFIRQIGGTTHTLIWPNSQGTLGSILTNNGNGTMSWVAVTDTNDTTKYGSGAGGNIATGSFNTFIGKNAGLNTSGTTSNNTAIGYNAGRGSITGLTGENNVFVGIDAGRDLTSGYENVIIGNSAGNTLQTGYRNVIIGKDTGINIPINSYNNIIIGYSANASSSSNIVIGNQASVSNFATSCTVIGNNAVATEGYCTVIGSSITGNVTGGFFIRHRQGSGGVNIARFNGNELVEDAASSIKFKQDINTYIPNDNFQNIRPATYRYKSDTTNLQYGFIAEELYELYPEFVILGQNKDDSEFYKKPYNVDYIKMCVLLVHEVQKLRADNQDREISELKSDNALLKSQQAAQSSQIQSLTTQIESILTRIL